MAADRSYVAWTLAGSALTSSFSHFSTPAGPRFGL